MTWTELNIGVNSLTKSQCFLFSDQIQSWSAPCHIVWVGVPKIAQTCLRVDQFNRWCIFPGGAHQVQNAVYKFSQRSIFQFPEDSCVAVAPMCIHRPPSSVLMGPALSDMANIFQVQPGGPTTHADKLLAVPTSYASNTNVLPMYAWIWVENYVICLFFAQCVFLFDGRCQNVFVMLMRMEVCWWSDCAANGPAGCENLFHCLSLFSTLVWPSCWVCACVCVFFFWVWTLDGNGSKVWLNMYVSTEL